MVEDEILSTGMTFEDLREKYPVPPRKDPSNPGARVKSFFFVSGESLNEAAFSNVAGTPSTEFRVERTRGRWIPSGKANVLPPEWSIEVAHDPCDDIEETVIELLNILEPRTKEISSYIRNNGLSAGFRTSVFVHEDAPLYSLSGKTFQSLAAFDLEWILDIY